MSLKPLIKRIAPAWVVSGYHFCLAYLAAFWYGFPSKEMVVIGVTGTKGKTSTCNFIGSCLSAGGYEVGLLSTANIKIGQKEFLNNFHMTMPGRFSLQRLLFQMVQAGCKMCVIETSSEGIKQFRHKGIIYDILVFTNLSPEHLPSHDGSFEKYKEAKGRVFAELNKGQKKVVGGIEIKKMIVANYDDSQKDYFLSFPVDHKATYGLGEGADFQAHNIKAGPSGVDFQVKEASFHLDVLGEFNVYNALPAIVLAEVCGIAVTQVQRGLEQVRVIPGRMEKIEMGQSFTVLVDYAHEGRSMNAALDAARKIVLKGAKVIVLLGAEGGGRDKNKRSQMGEVAGAKADYVVASNVDPYDDPPEEIIEDIVLAAEKAGKVRNKNLFAIEDRREGIVKALSLANKGDIVMITGKGAEQSMIIRGKSFSWDDRMVVREGLDKLRLGA
ncbi:MAG: UDP-N-acetylmuramyl-tripeptide synthetase [Candidatus Pacebacteria bacterium]|nr:UDP-N-acetylmuramyl-tripeptide synthetase [Candidatus Paceibacterota bacterium]